MGWKDTVVQICWEYWRGIATALVLIVLLSSAKMTMPDCAMECVEVKNSTL